MEKRDCFAWLPNECYALKKKDCDGCGFYKRASETVNISAIEEVIRQREREAVRLARAEKRKEKEELEKVTEK